MSRLEEASMRELPIGMVEKVRHAAETFAAAGYDAARMEDLATATGIPTSTMYYYFAGKQELLAFLLSDYLDTLTAAVTASIVDTETPPHQLAAVVQAHLQVMAENPKTCQILLTELGRVGRLPEIAEAVQSAVHRPMQKILTAGVADRSFASLDPEIITSLIYGAVTMTALHHFVSGKSFASKKLARDVLAALLDGIRG
jgi:TetR/AcrR family transcriptional regulator